jgi:hypothetical protein
MRLHSKTARPRIPEQTFTTDLAQKEINQRPVMLLVPGIHQAIFLPVREDFGCAKKHLGSAAFCRGALRDYRPIY